MRIRKSVALVLALVIALGYAAPAFASTGYGDDTSDPNSFAPPTADNPAPVSTEQVTAAASAAIEQAVAQAAATGGNAQAVVSLVNVSVVPAAALQNVFAEAAKAGVTNAVTQIDARDGGVVLSRVYIDAATAAKLSGNVDLSVAVRGAEVQKTVDIFEKYFDNKTASISLGQKGAFGAEVQMAAKVDLSQLNTSSLVFYVFNPETNRFAQLTPAYRVDANGYLHFSTPVGGNIVITDKPLVRK